MSEPYERDRASFQYRGYAAMFRHVQTVGAGEYLHEDYKGGIVLSLVNPVISFHSFVEDEIKKIMDSAT